MQLGILSFRIGIQDPDIQEKHARPKLPQALKVRSGLDGVHLMDPSGHVRGSNEEAGVELLFLDPILSARSMEEETQPRIGLAVEEHPPPDYVPQLSVFPDVSQGFGGQAFKYEHLFSVSGISDPWASLHQISDYRPSCIHRLGLNTQGWCHHV